MQADLLNTRNMHARTDGARGKKVAAVTLLGSDGERRTFDATLVGADKARDLVVIKVCVLWALLCGVCGSCVCLPWAECLMQRWAARTRPTIWR